MIDSYTKNRFNIATNHPLINVIQSMYLNDEISDINRQFRQSIIHFSAYFHYIENISHLGISNTYTLMKIITKIIEFKNRLYLLTYHWI